MSNYIVVDGDRLNFEPMFGVNTVTPTAHAIRGSGVAAIENKKICIRGDEKKVSVSAIYSSAGYPNQGTGTITIASLATDQLATFSTAETELIVVGSRFTALFTVDSPATHPQNGPDPVSTTSGRGTFINSQSFVTAG